MHRSFASLRMTLQMYVGNLRAPHYMDSQAPGQTHGMFGNPFRNLLT
jgi:hypothetical protein